VWSSGKREESSSPRGAAGDCQEESPELNDILQVQASRIIAQVQIDGRVFNATIDTGTSRSFVSERVAQLVGTPHNVRTVRTQVSLAEGPRKEITKSLVAKVQLDQRWVTFPLLVLPSIMEDVLLGMDFLCGVSATLQCGRVSIQLNPLLVASTKVDSALSPLLINESSSEQIDNFEATVLEPQSNEPERRMQAAPTSSILGPREDTAVRNNPFRRNQNSVSTEPAEELRLPSPARPAYTPDAGGALAVIKETPGPEDLEP